MHARFCPTKSDAAEDVSCSMVLRLAKLLSELPQHKLIKMRLQATKRITSI